MKLYTTHCPKCFVLETKLDQKKVPYEMIEDTTLMQEKGFDNLPILELDNGDLLDFVSANKFINSLEVK